MDETKLATIAREAVFIGGRKTFLRGDVTVGLSSDFTIKAHLMLPEAYANNLYTYLLNFQIDTPQRNAEYEQSRPLPEDDIYLYADSDWNDPAYPNGLAVFDPRHRVRLTLLWRVEKGHVNDCVDDGASEWFCPPVMAV